MSRLQFALAWALLAGSSPVEATCAEAVVKGFLSEVRSGKKPDAAANYLAEQVLAHQMTSEGVQTVVRTPKNYAQHVRDFLRLFGSFELTIEEVISANDRVFVRWRQTGCHCGSIDGETPTGRPLVEIASVVYRVADSRIVEYWLQTDRKGFETQLERLRSGR